MLQIDNLTLMDKLLLGVANFALRCIIKNKSNCPLQLKFDEVIYL